MDGRVGALHLGSGTGLLTAAQLQDASLAVTGPLRPLLPEGITPGSTVGVAGSIGLALVLVAGLAGADRWVAGVDWGPLGLVAARELGLRWDRLIVVESPDQESWPTVLTVTLDAFDIVLLRSPKGCSERDVRRSMARARERGTVLVAADSDKGTSEWWRKADVQLRATEREWDGLGDGHGYLRQRHLVVEASGRGRLARGRRLELWLPGPGGQAVEAPRSPLIEAELPTTERAVS